ncbi:single-stranded DNA-binding protein [Serratia fonticola]|uniref:Single-stranded DNA-binding protein n=1 Tax=Serratia fonticola TaxID=47917 RepID=A0ABY9PWQ0_SERFO|nr:single-stranded DNA-binding protein [Serratia fonticola]WMT17218.1 single-stranded DNA-binding protein [Serratia fonticola]WMT17227.1 single-stranded DNA-binding protein [Serratia fonticola]
MSLIKVEVKPSQALADTRSGVSKTTGKPYTISEQSAYIYLGGDYPELFKITLDEGQKAYPVGLYSLSETSLYIGQFNKLTVGRIKLVPIK